MSRRGGGDIDPKLYPLHDQPAGPRGPAGKLHREPVVRGAEVIDIGNLAESGGMPLAAAKRAAVMGWGSPARQVAQKFAGPGTGHGDRPGDIPSEGTPTGNPQAKPGSALPVVSASRAVQSTEEEWTDLVNSGNVIAPPYDPWVLVCTVEESDSLPPLIGAMVTNVTGFGFTTEATFAMRDDEGEPLPAPDGADQQRDTLALFMATAKIGDGGLIGTLQRVDEDKYQTGNGYLEVLRNSEGVPGGLEHLPTWTMRLGKLSQPVLVDMPFRHPTTGDLVTVRKWMRFRTFVQIREGRIAYFKEYGDPRHINWRSGAYQDEPWPVDQNNNDQNGTEVLHRICYSAHSPYGVPKWIGAVTHARAGRAAGELLVSWFRDAPIGVKLALIAGGTWNDDSYRKALGKIDAMARGKENAWKFVGLEANFDSGDLMKEDGNPAPPRMSLEDLVTEIPDGIYKGDGNMIDGSFRRVAKMFRLPPVYYGASEDHSRASVNSARAVAEEQIFVPERELGWLQWFNTELLPSLGVFLWRVGLRGANTSDDTEVAKGIAPLIAGGGASPNMLIRLWNEVTGQDAEPITEPWGDRPWTLTNTLIQAGLDPNLPLADTIGTDEDNLGAELDADGQPLVVDDAAKTALNGAQVTAAREIVLDVVAGLISETMARAMLKAFFNLDDTTTSEILADVDSIRSEQEAEPEEVPEVPGDFDELEDDEREQVQRRVLKAAAVQRLASLAAKVEREVEANNPGWFA